MPPTLPPEHTRNYLLLNWNQNLSAPKLYSRSTRRMTAWAFLSVTVPKQRNQHIIDTTVIPSACSHHERTTSTRIALENLERPVLLFFLGMMSTIREKFSRRAFRMPFSIFAKLTNILSSTSNKTEEKYANISTRTLEDKKVNMRKPDY